MRAMRLVGLLAGIAATLAAVTPADAIAASKLAVKAPSDATAGTSFAVTVIAKNRDGSRDADYRGKVSFTSSDEDAVLPSPYKFKGSDAGRHKFAGVVLKTAGDQTVAAEDVAKPKVKGEDTVTVAAGALDHLVLSPADATVAPPAPVVATADYVATMPTSQTYAAEGFDESGNDLGDVTAQTTFTTSPAGASCAGSSCSGTNPGDYTVTGTVGPATGQAALTVETVDNGYTMTCKGENYDVNGSKTDGCEAAQPNPGRTAQGAAHYLGNFPCTDGSSTQNFSGKVLSDTRTHQNPAVVGFSSTTGSAPDFNRLHADGGACTDDLSITITTTGGSSAGTCYRLSVITSNGTFTTQVSGSGNASIIQGSGSYTDDSDIYFKVEKTCNLPLVEAVNYTITGHL